MRLSLRILIISFCLFFLSNNLIALNNTPCTATTLTVNSSCSYIYSTTVGATYSSNATNFGTPSCASPGSPDVWFQFVAPAGGSVRIQTATGTGTMTDSGMALYSTTTGATFPVGEDLNIARFNEPNYGWEGLDFGITNTGDDIGGQITSHRINMIAHNT